MARGRPSRGWNRRATNADQLDIAPEQKAFLARSLDRNDADIASLQKLNKTLREARENLIAACGEETLLDVGNGRLKVINQELYQRKDGAPDAFERAPLHRLNMLQQQICVDFMLRMTLRRRLNNRLARRMNRVANSLDLEDVAPPPMPKYGDKRLELDRKAAKEHAEKRMHEELAKDRINNFRTFRKLQAEINAGSSIKSEDATEADASGKGKEKPDNPTSSIEKEKPSIPPTHLSMAWDPSIQIDLNFLREHDDTHEMLVKDFTSLSSSSFKVLNEKDTGMEEAAESTIRVGASHRTMGVHDRESEYDRWRTALLSRVPDQPTFEELAMGSPVFNLEERQKLLAEKKLAPKKEEKSSSAKVKSEDPSVGEKTKPEDSGKIKDGEAEIKGDEMETEDNDDKEKKAEDDKEESEAEAKAGKEKETGVDTKVDKNEEKGMDKVTKDSGEKGKDDGPEDSETKENNPEEKYAAGSVTNSEEGEKVEKADGKEKENEGADSKDSIEGEDPKTDDEAKANSSESQKKPVSEEKSSDGEKPPQTDAEVEEPEDKAKMVDEEKTDEDESADEDDEKSDDMEDEDEDALSDSKTKEIELEKIKEKKRKADALVMKITKRVSLQPVPSFHEQDVKRIRLIHSDMTTGSVMAYARRRLAIVTNEYNVAFRMSNQIFERRQQIQHRVASVAHESHSQLEKIKVQIAMERRQWINNKREHDMDQAKRCLPSTWGRQPSGTSATAQYVQAGGLLGAIGSCVADIVDGSLLVAEGSIALKRFDQPPPPQISPEAIMKQRSQASAEMRRELDILGNKLNNCEEERKVAWRKLLKVKTELKLPHVGPNGQQFYLDANNMNLVPLPPLRSSRTQEMPQHINIPPPSVPGYSGEVASDGYAKYASARNRHRMSSDGTIAPISLPRKKNGLYQRPAGRTRKGMQWDAVRGIWVPDDAM